MRPYGSYSFPEPSINAFKKYNTVNSRYLSLPYLRVYKPHSFWQEFTLQNWGAAYKRNLKKYLDTPRKSRYHIDDWAHDAGIVCCETPSRDR
jgi:hypothetical protein